MSLAQTNTQCRWIYSANNDTSACQRTFQAESKKWQVGADCNASSKGQFDNTCCCPISAASNKYIVIGIIAGVLGVIAILSFALNKNETE